MLTNREVFDKVKAHLLAQGERAKNDGECVYRASNGMKCAVGCLIDDEYYSPDFEGASISRDNNGKKNSILLKGYGLLYKALHLSGVSKESFNMLFELQMCHDEHPVDSWKDRLDYLERMYF